MIQVSKVTVITLLGWIFFLGFIDAVDDRYFPENFKFGVATASYQVEGAWDADGKGENIWDRLTHTTPELIDDQSSGDISCDAYHKTDDDIALLKDLGVDFYRLSLSWSRILPTGHTNQINQAGVDYYNNLLTKLQENDIEAMVTLYHWDLPQPLQDLGGWPNQQLEIYFANYARLAFELFGDKVKYWVTFNEPLIVCDQGYGTGGKAPALHTPGIGPYLCSRTLLKAHARAYHIYTDGFKPRQQGKISIVLSSNWFEPGSDSAEDIEAAERKIQFTFGWFAHPIFFGNYPQVMIDRIAARSEQEGFHDSRLVPFTEDEINYVKGTHDFIGVNTYTTSLVKWKEESPIGEPSVDKDTSVSVYHDESWEPSASSWLWIVPWGIKNLTTWVKNTYNNPEIIITENGVSDRGELEDETRANYYRDYLTYILEAIYDNGANVTMYTAWSFMDNYEWFRGYTEKFGLYHVDFEDPERPRTPKQSTTYYKNVVATKCLVDACN